MRQRSHEGAKYVRGTRHTPRLQLHRLARVEPRYGREPHRRHRLRGLPRADLPRPGRARRRSVSSSLQVRAVSATDNGIATRAFRPDAQAAARGAGHAATFATTEHLNLQVSRAITVPVLAFVGTVTFLRLVRSSIEDIARAHRIGLVRSHYLRVSPELEPYLVALRGTRAAP